jgi:hypothetical protein
MAESTIRVNPEDTIEQFIMHSTAYRCWMVPPGVSNIALSIAMRSIWEKESIGLIELLDFSPRKPLTRWIATRSIECTLLIQVHTERHTIFGKPNYDKFVSDEVLEGEEAARAVLFKATQDWPCELGVQVLVTETCQLRKPSSLHIDETISPPGWYILQRIKIVRNTPLRYLS